MTCVDSIDEFLDCEIVRNSTIHRNPRTRMVSSDGMQHRATSSHRCRSCSRSISRIRHCPGQLHDCPVELDRIHQCATNRLCSFGLLVQFSNPIPTRTNRSHLVVVNLYSSEKKQRVNIPCFNKKKYFYLIYLGDRIQQSYIYVQMSK